MHDKNGTPVKAGDRIILTGTIKEITSDQPTYCNITVITDESMAPEVAEGTALTLSARMVIKGELIQVHAPEMVNALRAAACQIRDLGQQLHDTRRIANAREDALQSLACRIAGQSARNYGGDSCGVLGLKASDGYGLPEYLEGLAKQLEASIPADVQKGYPEGPEGLTGRPGPIGTEGVQG